MIYRKLKTEETTIQEGDVVATAFHRREVGESVQSQVGGTTFALRPVPDESEDVVMVNGTVIASHDSPYYQDVTITVEMPGEEKVGSLIGQRVTLLIHRPEPPMPKCPYCGMEMEVKHSASEYWAKCSYPNCKVEVHGPCRPTRREAIEAMTQKGGGQ